MSLIEQTERLEIRVTKAPGKLDQLSRVVECPRDVIGHKKQTAHLHPQQQPRLMTVGLPLEQLDRASQPTSADRIVIALIVLSGELQRHPSRRPLIAILLEASLGALQQIQHLVIP